MTNLKRSFFWAAFYLAVIFILGQTDYSGRPIINFASYFYLAVILAVPITLFFPSITTVSHWVPLAVWAGVYIVLLQSVDRRISTSAGDVSIVILEFILLEAGVWLAYQLALQISHAESVMDALALSAFPNKARDIEAEAPRIQIEVTRSRRYHRPLSLLVIDTGSITQPDKELLRNVQHDLMNRFTYARVGQIIDEHVRQTDLVLKDRGGRFMVLCPETDKDGIQLLAKRITQVIGERTSLQLTWGAASFPEEALTFDDLLQSARERLAQAQSGAARQVAVLNTSH